MKKAIPILLILGLVALALEIMEILGGILILIIAISCLLIAFILWLVKLVS